MEKRAVFLLGAAGVLAVICLLLGFHYFANPPLKGYGIYVANEGDGTISVIDGSTFSVVDTIRIENSHPHNVNIDPLGRYLYATNHEGMEDGHEMGEDGYLRVIEVDSRDLIASIPLGAKAAHIVPSGDGSRVYVSLEGSDRIIEISTQDFSIIRDLHSGEMPHGIVLSRNGKFLLSPNMMGNDVALVDLQSGEAENFNVTYGNSNCEKPTAMGITSDDKYAFVTCSDSFDVFKIDVSAKGAIGRAAFVRNNPPGPIQVPVDPSGKYLYVPDMRNRIVHKIDIETFKEVASIKTGAGAHGIAYSPDGAYAFVTNTYENTLSVIDLGTDGVVKTIKVGVSPNGVAVAGGKNQGW